MGAAVSVRTKRRVYRASILRMWAFYYFVLVVAVPLILWIGGFGMLAGAALLAHLVLSMAVAMAAAVLVAVLVTVEVKPEGIRGQTFWSLPVLAHWDEMGRIGTFRILGINGLRVDRGADRLALYFPLFLKGMPGVIEEIARSAPPDNVLRRFFRV